MPVEPSVPHAVPRPDRFLPAGMQGEGGPIGLMAALPEELAAVLDIMPDEAQVQLGGRTFWVGHLHGREVVAVLSGIGKVAAATTTTLLAGHFGVSQIVFVGVAGGLGEGVRVGDVVLADALLQHDMDASPLFPRFELPGTGLSRLPADPARVTLARETLAAALAPEVLSMAQPHPLRAEDLTALGLTWPRLHTGLIVSGDQFVCTDQASAALRTALPDALAVEMEGAAVAQVCRDLTVPCLVIRTVSDRADDAAHIDFPRFLQTVASPYAGAMLAHLVPAL